MDSEVVYNFEKNEWLTYSLNKPGLRDASASKNQARQQNIKYDNQNTKYANQNTNYANQKFTLFCREAIFVANLSTFLAYFFQAKKYGGVPKMTNIRYMQGYLIWPFPL